MHVYLGRSDCIDCSVSHPSLDIELQSHSSNDKIYYIDVKNYKIHDKYKILIGKDTNFK